MSKLFAGKYKLGTLRMLNWDYASMGVYFITICTYERAKYFGDIIDGKMHLSEIGEIAKQEWFRSQKIRPDMNLIMDEFIAMPDHIHGILCMGKNEYNRPPEKGTPLYQNKFGPQRKNLASVIRGYKSSVTTFARKSGLPFQWQSKFYESKIRSEVEYERIVQYIRNNPMKWNSD
jgi:putative transposase